MTSLLLFASTFVLVFALGVQSLNVNNGHYWAAALTSLVIGSMQMISRQKLYTLLSVMIAAGEIDTVGRGDDRFYHLVRKAA